MATFKCKMCGGDLDVQAGVSVVECEYCGTRQTVPAADDEKKLTLFNRANRLRLNNEFDKASGVYEAIVADFPEEAEAYWGLLLCNYGVEYVDDPATGKKVPTCHRSSFDSILDDQNLEMACEYADAYARRQYRDEAKQLEEIRKGIIEVSSKEEPYDIFICYKETDENGDRTLDSVLAQDVYDALTDKGYRVFFSRITLESKLGTEYEPYIFAALNSAKVMLAFGTDYEYYNAVWVKNEWSRFLRLMAAGQKKMLIPCYKGIDAYDMPKEFAKLQAQDMGKVGATQDLLRGIDKIFDRDKKATATAPAAVAVASGTPGVAPLLKRAFMSLEEGEWKKADDLCEQVLNQDPENATAYLGKLMAELKVKKTIELKNSTVLFGGNPLYQKAVKFADENLKKGLLDSEKQVREKQQDIIFDKAKELYYSEKIADIKKAKEMFYSISYYENAQQYYLDCDTRIKVLKNEQEEAEHSKKVLLVSGIVGVTIVLCMVIYFAFGAPLIKYNEAVSDYNNGNFDAAYSYFSNSDYKNSKEMAKKCQYGKAVAQYNNGEYEEALKYFSSSSYDDSEEMALKCKYGYVKKYYNNSNLTTYEYLKALKSENFKDSADLFKELYAWKVTLECVNTNETDYDTKAKTVDGHASYLHYGFVLSGGEPGAKGAFYNKCIWPDGETRTSDWYWEDKGTGDWLQCQWDQGIYSSSGKLTFEIHDKSNDELIGSASVMLT